MGDLSVDRHKLKSHLVSSSFFDSKQCLRT